MESARSQILRCLQVCGLKANGRADAVVQIQRLFGSRCPQRLAASDWLWTSGATIRSLYYYRLTQAERSVLRRVQEYGGRSLGQLDRNHREQNRQHPFGDDFPHPGRMARLAGS